MMPPRLCRACPKCWLMGQRWLWSRSSKPTSIALSQQLFEHFLPVFESLFQAGRDENPLGQIAQWSEARVVFNQVAHSCPTRAFSHLHRKLVTMLESLEWSFFLYVGEVVVPFKFNNQRDPFRT